MRGLDDLVDSLVHTVPLNGHFLKADTSLNRTHGVGPCRTSVIYFISLQGGHLSKADSRSWSRPSVSTLEGVDCIMKVIISIMICSRFNNGKPTLANRVPH